MSADLIDLRAKIDELTDTVLDDEQAETGADRSELVRCILHDWAVSKVRRATLLCKRLDAQGIVGKARE
jgi:hypothetical protein